MSLRLFQNHPCLVWQVGNVREVTLLRSNLFDFEGCKYQLILEQSPHADSFCIYIQLFSFIPYHGTRIVTFTPTCIYVTGKRNIKTFLQCSSFMAQSSFTAPFSLIETKLWKVRRQDLFNEILDVMTIVCMIGSSNVFPDGSSEKSLHDKSNQTYSYSSESPSLNSLSIDLDNLLQSKIEPDVYLQIGDRLIPAHKSILRARSQVFDAMFRNGLPEEKSQIFSIKDIEDSLLDQFLLYLYTGKLPNVSESNIRGLYVAAARYNVEALKQRCSDFMMANMTKDKAFESLTFADTYSDKDLKQNIMSFIFEDENMLKSHDWLTFWKIQPQLALEVYTQYVRKQ